MVFTDPPGALRIREQLGAEEFRAETESQRVEA